MPSIPHSHKKLRDFGSRRVLGTLLVATCVAVASSAAAPLVVAADGPPSQIRGQVLLPDGTPAANVPVLVYWRSLLAETTADAEGRFALELDPEEVVEKTSTSDWPRVPVAAFAQGYGPGWKLLEDTESGKPITLRLVDDLPVQGRVLDQQGRPVVKATVRLFWLHDADGNLDGFLQATRDTPTDTELQRYTQQHMQYLNPDLTQWWKGNRSSDPREHRVETDEEGRFEVQGLGRERSLYVEISGPGIATQTAYIVTRAKIDARWKRGSLSRESKLYLESGATIPPVFPADFVYLGAPGLTLHGTLRDAASGKPVAGMGVSASMRGTSSHGYVRDTGPDGQYEIHGMPLEGKLRIAALNTGQGPYLDAQKELVISGDKRPGPIDFLLDRGVQVSGAVLDEAGRPVKGNVGYLAWPGNPQLEELSEPYDTYNTQSPDEKGRYSIVVPPGPGVLTFTASDRDRYSPASGEDFGFPLRDNGTSPSFVSQNRGYVWASEFSVLQRIDPEKGADKLRIDLTVRSGQPIVGQLITSDGHSIKGYRARGLTSFAATERRGGAFRVRGLKPGETRRVFFVSDDQQWATVKEFARDDADQPQTVRLDRTGTLRGRIIDPSGKPLSEWIYAAGSRGILAASGGRGLRPVGTFEFAEGATDADGFFFMKGVPANVPVEIVTAERPAAGKPLKPFLVTRVTLRPGQDLDLGELRLDDIVPQSR